MAAITIQMIPYGGVNGATVSCLFAEIAVARERGHTVRFVRTDGDSLLPRRRSVALSQFYELGKDDVMVTIDHDISWKPGGLTDIAERALETDSIVGGLYSKRAMGQGFASRIKTDSPKMNITIPTNRIIEAEYVGSGYMAIPRAAIRKIVEDPEKALLARCWDGKFEYWDFYHTMSMPHPARPELMEYLSEDWALCERAKRCGIKCFIDLRPLIIHIGEKGYNIGDATQCTPQPQQNS